MYRVCTPPDTLHHLPPLLTPSTSSGSLRASLVSAEHFWFTYRLTILRAHLSPPNACTPPGCTFLYTPLHHWTASRLPHSRTQSAPPSHHSARVLRLDYALRTKLCAGLTNNRTRITRSADKFCRGSTAPSHHALLHCHFTHRGTCTGTALSHARLRTHRLRTTAMGLVIGLLLPDALDTYRTRFLPAFHQDCVLHFPHVRCTSPHL